MEGIVFGLHIGKDYTHNKEISVKGRNQTKERTWPEETLSLFVVIPEKNTLNHPQILLEILNTHTKHYSGNDF